VALADTVTGQREMAQKAALPLAQHGEQDIETPGHGAAGPSITEVAMSHALSQATLGLDAEESGETDTRVDPTTDPVEHIVVDLRTVETADRLDRRIELILIREVPTVIDFEALEPITLPRPDGDSVLLDIDPWEMEPVSEPEAGPSLTESVSQAPIPLNGLATASRTERAVKRAIDITVALLAFLILSPFLILIAALVKTTSRGPVLYRSTRVGKDGMEFTFFKFRSMYNGAADDLSKLAARNEQSGPVFKMREDPRITPLGRCLRKASIDELPQLLHVLSGKMSLVGPRPALPGEVSQYDMRAIQRLAVKPGITCTWQVSGRSELDFDTWVNMDVEYIRGWTLLNDLRLLLQTVPAVLSGRGAY